MNEITIVTAFFDIGRDNWSGYERGNNKYINYFKFWARIRNKLVIYTDTKFIDEIMEIRKNFGLVNKTKIIAVDNIVDFDKDLFYRIEKVMNNKIALYFHEDIERPEAWNAKYNYVMMLKYYCIVDAIKNKYIDGMISWIDFGFNHGGKDGLVNAAEFDFLWNYNFSNKMHLFTYKEIDINRPIFDIVKSMDAYIRGNIIVGPAKLWIDFLSLAKESMVSLTRCGLCDDDQTIELMTYYEKPDMFELHDVRFWYDGIKLFGGEHLTVREEEPYKDKFYKVYKYRARNFLAYGRFKLAILYYKKYLRERIRDKLLI